MAPFIFWNLAFYTIIRTQLLFFLHLFVGEFRNKQKKKL
ncbi:LexA repressor-like protein [Paenibacillus larvae subsp. larvae DSM 25430]|nr:LexA repressor-like protein [Paenibacillus larvae subsp. larvae DSM 25430]